MLNQRLFPNLKSPKSPSSARTRPVAILILAFEVPIPNCCSRDIEIFFYSRITTESVVLKYFWNVSLSFTRYDHFRSSSISSIVCEIFFLCLVASHFNRYFNGVHVLKNDQVISILNFGIFNFFLMFSCLTRIVRITVSTVSMNSKPIVNFDSQLLGQLTACLAPQQQIQQPKYNVNGKSYNVVNQNQLTSSEHCFRSIISFFFHSICEIKFFKVFLINKVPIKWINAIWPLMQVYLCVLFWFHLRTHNLGVVRQQYSSSSLERTQSSSHTSMHLTFLIFFKDWLQVNTLLSYSNHQRKEMVSTLHSNKPTGQHSPVQPFVKKPLILHPQGIFSKNQRLICFDSF